MPEGPGLRDRQLRLLIAERQIENAENTLNRALNLLARCRENGWATADVERTVGLASDTLGSMRTYRDLLIAAARRDSEDQA
jgi:hypothetical protein